MSETLTEIDEASVDFQAPVEYEAPIESGQIQDQKESADEKYKFNSIEDVIQAQANDGREWQRVGESAAGSEKLNFKTQESYYQDKQNVVLNRERDAEILDQLFDQGFAIKERIDGDKTTREIYFADSKGQLSFVIDTVSSEQKPGNVEGDNESELGLFDSSAEDRTTNAGDDRQDLRLSFLTEHLHAVAAESAESVTANTDSNQESEVVGVSVETTVAFSIEAPQSAIEYQSSEVVAVSEITSPELQDNVVVEVSQQESQDVVEVDGEQRATLEIQRDLQEFGIGLVEDTKVVVQKFESVQLTQSSEIQTTRTERGEQREEVGEDTVQINEAASVNAAEEGIVLVEMGDDEEVTENIDVIDGIEEVSIVEDLTVADLPETKAVSSFEDVMTPAVSATTRVESQASVLTISQPEKSLGIELDARVSDEVQTFVTEKSVAQPAVTEMNKEVAVGNTEILTVETQETTVVAAVEASVMTEQSQSEQTSEATQVESTVNVIEMDVEVAEDTVEEPEVVSERLVETIFTAEQPIEIISEPETVVKAEATTEVRESNVVEFRTTEKVVAETIVQRQEAVDARVNLTEVVVQNESEDRVVLFRRESESVQEQTQVVESFRAYQNEIVTRSTRETFRSQQNSSTNDANVIEEEAELEPQAISLAA